MSTDRSLAKTAKQATTTAASTGGQKGAEANQIGASLIPGFESEANNPTGFTPTQQNNMLVASEQGAGGANAGITGQANLTAGRTRNAGGYAAALDEAARQKGRTLSQNALNVQNENAQLQQNKQQFAQRALQGLYGTDTSAMMESMGLVPKDVEAGAEANRSGWMQDLTGLLGSLGSLGSGAAAARKAF